MKTAGSVPRFLFSVNVPPRDSAAQLLLRSFGPCKSPKPAAVARAASIGARSQAQRQIADQAAVYEMLRDRYVAERRAYRRVVWPDRYRGEILARDARLIGNRVEIVNGDRVGTVEAVARTRAGQIEALKVASGSGATVWIDEADIRFNRQDRIVRTNLDRTDLRQMADHRL